MNDWKVFNIRKREGEVGENRPISVSVPGKIHFLGEHIAVYGRPALLASIDKRIRIILTPQESKITIVSKNFDQSESLSIDKVLEKTKQARETWNKFIETKDVSYLTSITKEPLDYPFLAVGQTLIDYSSSEVKKSFDKAQGKIFSRPAPPAGRRTSFARNIESGFSIEIDSDIPLSSGCGSSSAVAIGIIAAISAYFGKPLGKNQILETAIRIEQFKHGTPSGGDSAIVLYGGFVLFQKLGDKRIVKELGETLSANIKKNFFLIDSGKPEESTGEMIAHVRELKEKKPEYVDTVFNDQTRLVHELVDIIKHNDSTSIIYSIKAGERNLEKLGVVSPFVIKLIQEIENTGGAAKISGGGGVKKGTGMILAYAEDKEMIDRVCKKFDLSFFQTKLGSEGLVFH